MSRRDILKNTAILGALSATASRVGASPAEKDVELDAILNHPRVERLTEEIPGLELNTDDATAFGSDGSIVAVPGNYGKLIATNPKASGSTDDDVAATFHFDEWVPDVDDAWPRGTEARLTATDDELLLQRTVTDVEKRQFLSALDRQDLSGDDTTFVVAPERGRVHVTRVSSEGETERDRDRDRSRATEGRDTREIETLTAVGGQGFAELTKGQGAAAQSSTNVQLRVVDRTTYTPTDLTSDSEVFATAECDDEGLVADLFMCIMDYADCALCWAFSAPTPPVGLACWIIVCLDGGLSLALEYLADFGCIAGVGKSKECVESILDDVIDEYGDDVPTP